MSLYVDSSALLKRYVDEPGVADALLASDPSRHTIVEVRATWRGCSTSATPRPPRPHSRRTSRPSRSSSWMPACDAAADVAELTGARTLDALHIAAARRAGGGGPGVAFVTFDLRRAQAARTLGLTVLPG